MKGLANKLTVLVVFLLAGSIAASAQVVSRNLTPDSLSLKVIYKAGSAEPDWNNAQTNESISTFKQKYSDLLRDNDVFIDSVVVFGKTSPEGSFAINDRLSKARASRFLNAFALDSIKAAGRLHVVTTMLKWSSLVPVIQESNWEKKDQVLKIITNDNLTEMQKERQVRALGYSTWTELNKYYMNSMRTSEIHVYYQYQSFIYSPDSLVIDAVDSSMIVPVDTLARPDTLVVGLLKLPPFKNKDVKARIAVKVNGLEALAGIANIGTEIGFDHWSLDIPGTYSPYTIAKTYKAKLFAIQPEIRYWFGDYTMTKGHFIGLHTHVAGFNVHAGNGRRYQDPNRAVWGLGLSYGYALPLKAGTGWTMEFNIGAGYANIKYDVYENGKDGWFLYTDKLNYWGLTRLGVTVSYRFDIKK